MKRGAEREGELWDSGTDIIEWCVQEGGEWKRKQQSGGTHNGRHGKMAASQYGQGAAAL